MVASVLLGSLKVFLDPLDSSLNVLVSLLGSLAIGVVMSLILKPLSASDFDSGKSALLPLEENLFENFVKLKLEEK